MSEPGDPTLTEAVRLEGAVAVAESLTGSRAATAWAKRAAGLDLGSVVAATEACGARFITPASPEWPEQVAELDLAGPLGSFGGAPLGLWLRGPGDLAAMTGRTVAIVGSRAATSYGERIAADLGAELAAAGVTVVSGGAFGIDAAAHRGAMAAGGRTLCVLAGGVDQPYPRGNAALLEAIGEGHLLVSEVPPGAHPTRPRFLIRNRLIAGLTQATIIVEAAARSGARNTVSWANLLGRMVLAVPGPVHSAMSVTPHELIRTQQATLVCDSAQVLELISPMGLATLPEIRGPQRVTDDLTESEIAVFEFIPGRGALAAGDLALRAGLDMRSTLVTLTRLADRGLVHQDAEGGWRLVSGSVPG
ncbi:DNA-processing protein DprA [Granulicoccus phenolivorans]|uniref:DNA-processing protein DprA n=1 Tax=Granulicoccus phenolivorans TaxID=266854 RepID=UPI000767754E|nr:DNA-processing protein DprA [Granulicoccus phenolivorans]